MIAQLDQDLVNLRPWLVPRRLLSHALFEGRPLTTGGQWLNPWLFRLFSVVQKIPLQKEVRKPIYILGTGRSGTTILGKLFHAHSHCGFLNEPKAMWHFIYPFEDLIGSYTRGKAFYRLKADAATQEVRLRAHRLFSFYLFATGAQRVVDKYPEMVFRVPFLRAIFPDARFVFIVRNGMDTLQSISMWSKGHQTHAGQETHDWWGVNQRKWQLLLEQVVAHDKELSPQLAEISALTSQADMAAVEWVVTMHEGLHYFKTLPEAFHLVHYEELVHNPEKHLASLLDFCELPPSKEMLTYARNVLTLPPPKKLTTPHPILQPAFQKAMNEMGYVME
jgi:LPS sulfotransferase NodH